jgi:hypothetical protein
MVIEDDESWDHMLHLAVREQDNVSFTFITTVLKGVIDVFGQLHPLNLIFLDQKKYG